MRNCVVSFLLACFASVACVACVACLASAKSSIGTPLERPFIWIQAKDRPALLEKIDSHEWAASLYKELKSRADETVSHYQADREAFLKGLPLEWFQGEDKAPRFYYIDSDGGSKPGQAHREALMKHLQESISCGVVYFITQDESYARCAADVLATTVEALSHMERNRSGNNNGLVYPNDHLKEARVFGAQIPLIYDFIHPYISQGKPVYDLVSGTEVPFPFETAQKVFRTYADMALETGIVDCNWPVLEATSLLHNILALDDPATREELIPYVLEVDLPHQDSIKKFAASYEKPGDMWPESLGYSTHVSQFCVYLMTALDRLDPSLKLGAKYPNIAASLAGVYHIQFPNGDAPAFGDGHRRYEHPYLSFEQAHLLASLNGNEEQMEVFGSLIKSGQATGDYDRGELDQNDFGASPYKVPLQLLWQQGELKGTAQEYPQNRTETLPFAGIYLQRNLSPTDSAHNSLMAWVGGSHYVHGHASGMNIELYGKGAVLGLDNGKGTYRTDIHENYYRLFASHNTVISNGASASKGGWVSVGINTIELKAMEPMPRTAAVSPDHSFSSTTFYDEHNLVAPAHHERTLAVVRTSETTGYYVDVFRAKSEAPDQFHDYVYHNIGESLHLASDNQALPLGPDDGRYSGPAQLPWVSNKTYRHPGWHFFEKVQISQETDQPIQAVFHAKEAGSSGLGMRVFINGATGRDYASVMAPPAKLNSVKYYEKKNTPTLVVRQRGEAWQKPFAAVFEPYSNSPDTSSVRSVEQLDDAGSFKGFRIVSKVEGKLITQLVLIQDQDAVYANEALGLRFEGHFAIVTLSSDDTPQSIYIGHGKMLQIGTTTLAPAPGQTATHATY